jgi:hypothetical protein
MVEVWGAGGRGDATNGGGGAQYTRAYVFAVPKMIFNYYISLGSDPKGQSIFQSANGLIIIDAPDGKPGSEGGGELIPSPPPQYPAIQFFYAGASQSAGNGGGAGGPLGAGSGTSGGASTLVSGSFAGGNGSLSGSNSPGATPGGGGSAGQNGGDGMIIVWY